MFPVSQLFALSLNFLSTYWHEPKILVARIQSHLKTAEIY